jgi:hypothetical protein
MIGTFACHFLQFLRVKFLTFRHVRTFIRLLSFCPHPFVPSPISFMYRPETSGEGGQGGEVKIVIMGEALF